MRLLPGCSNKALRVLTPARDRQARCLDCAPLLPRDPCLASGSRRDRSSWHPEAMQSRRAILATDRIEDDGLQMVTDSHVLIRGGQDHLLPDCSFRALGLFNTGIAS
jgi:hypothetical protein